MLLLAMLPIGDTLFLTPTLRALRKRYPRARLTALAYASNAPLLRAVDDVDDVIEVPSRLGPRSVAEYASLVCGLRRDAFDVAIDFTSPAFKWIGIGAGIARRTYMRFDPGWWLLPGRHEAWKETHATRLYYDCAAGLDLPRWETLDHRPYLSVPDAAQKEADGFLMRAALSSSAAPLVAIHPGGKGLQGQKRWSEAHFVAVADALNIRYEARVVLVGGHEEEALARRVASHTKCDPIVAAGQLSLLGTAALLGRSALFIGNDSSLLHLAACQGTPYVGIFGPTCLANFQPIPLRPRQGRLAVAWPPPTRVSYFVGAQPIWSAPASVGFAEAALDTVTPELVLDYVDELLAEPTQRAAETALDDLPLSCDSKLD